MILGFLIIKWIEKMTLIIKMIIKTQYRKHKEFARQSALFILTSAVRHHYTSHDRVELKIKLFPSMKNYRK